MRLSKLLIFSLATLSLTSCNKDDEFKAAPKNEIYFNSFESEDDLNDFTGLYILNDDVAEDAGDSSLLVSGGCIVPHLYIDLGPFDDDKAIKLSLLGKNTSGSTGYVSLYAPEDYSSRIDIEINGDEWRDYNSSVLNLSKDMVLRLEFLSGGIAASNTFYDKVSITQE